MPETFLVDLAEVALGMDQHDPQALATAGPLVMTPLFECAVGFLKAPSLVHAAHARARLADLLFEVYLEPSAKVSYHDVHQRRGLPRHSGHDLLLSHPEAQRNLAPALLELYGGVESLAEEDKFASRVKVMRLLAHLWAAEEHRATFRRIARDHVKFLSFANGLLGHLNANVATVMEKLPEVRQIQMKQANAGEWAALSDDEREGEEGRLRSNEGELRYFLPLCNETISMLLLLSSDAEIRVPFLLPQLVDRLASTLLSVLVSLVGSKGLNIKVNNADELGFRPKTMLKEVSEAMAHFAASATFESAVATNGYYTTAPDTLRKVVSTLRKHSVSSKEVLGVLEAFVESVSSAAENSSALDESDAPEHFLDPILDEIMADPVRLPSSGKVMDRSTIEQHLLNDPTDPFNRAPLAISDLVPADDIKAAIEAWQAAKKGAAALGAGPAAMED